MNSKSSNSANDLLNFSLGSSPSLEQLRLYLQPDGEPQTFQAMDEVVDPQPIGQNGSPVAINHIASPKSPPHMAVDEHNETPASSTPPPPPPVSSSASPSLSPVPMQTSPTKPSVAEDDLVRRIHGRVGGPSRLSVYEEPSVVRRVVIEALAAEQRASKDASRIRQGQLTPMERRAVRTVTNRGAAVRSRLRQRREMANLRATLGARNVRVRQLESVVRALCSAYAVPLPQSLIGQAPFSSPLTQAPVAQSTAPQQCFNGGEHGRQTRSTLQSALNLAHAALADSTASCSADNIETPPSLVGMFDGVMSSSAFNNTALSNKQC